MWRWSLHLQDYIIDGTADNFSIELDPTQCNLGKWLLGEELEDVVARYPHLKEGFAALHEPHNTLHQSAQTIRELLSQAGWPRQQKPTTVSRKLHWKKSLVCSWQIGKPFDCRLAKLRQTLSGELAA